jgi:sugar phosphate isomerase/epimerase
MTSSPHATDGSARSPRMEIFQATWAMRDLPGSPEPFDLQAAVDWIAAAGFGGVMHWVDVEADFAAIPVIQRAGLLAGMGFPARDLAVAAAVIERACDSGITFLNAQVYDAFTEDAAAIARLEALYEAADRAGLPLFVETHRGMITQDLLRTVAYARAVPRVQFTLDASHYVVAGEVIDPDQAPRFQELLAEVVARSASLHARVSNGEQVQVDVGDGSAPVARSFVRWWTSAYRQWLSRARAGEFFPFVCELGPRPYAIAVPAGTAIPAGAELSDRRAQALVFKRIAEQIRSLE